MNNFPNEAVEVVYLLSENQISPKRNVWMQIALQELIEKFDVGS